jgi:prepilin-type N-terminal cleavage/methylation domain-containing protein
MRVVRWQRGFTLIELLTVIAIIAVLAAILMPVVHKTRETARQTACLSNLHQIAVALKAYWQDYRAYPPPPMLITDWDGDGSDDPPDTWEWVGGVSALVKDYLTSSALLICPDDRDAKSNANVVKAKNYSSYNGAPFVVNSGTGLLEPDYSREPDPGVSWRAGYNYFGYKNDGRPCSEAEQIVDLSAAGVDPHLADANGDGLHDQQHGKYTDIPSLAEFPRLRNRYAPGITIIVHCTHHRTLMSSKAQNQKDMAINLSGTSKKIPWQAWSLPNGPAEAPADGVKFVYQPPL